jgi:hypothetical protein
MAEELTKESKIAQAGFEALVASRRSEHKVRQNSIKSYRAALWTFYKLRFGWLGVGAALIAGTIIYAYLLIFN